MFKVRKASRKTIAVNEPLAELCTNKLEICSSSAHPNPLKPNIITNTSNLFNNKSRIYKRPQTSKPKDQ